jgi:predicted transcriptional regulator
MFDLGFSSFLRALGSAFKYRDRTSIMTQILETVDTSREGRKKTQIMQSANLNYLQTKKYLNYMMNCGFLIVTERETYLITEKGHKFLYSIEMERIRSNMI